VIRPGIYPTLSPPGGAGAVRKAALTLGPPPGSLPPVRQPPPIPLPPAAPPPRPAGWQGATLGTGDLPADVRRFLESVAEGVRTSAAGGALTKVGGGLVGFVSEKLGAKAFTEALGGAYRALTLDEYLAGGIVARELLLSDRRLITLGPRVGLAAKFFFGGPALVVTALATPFFKYFLPRTEGENLLFAFARYALTVGVENELFGGLREVLRDTFFQLDIVKSPFSNEFFFALIPIWLSDP
jgi:hypothetical protein